MKKFFSVLIIILMSIQLSYADAIVTIKAMKADTIAEVFIEEDKAVVELEIGMKDLPAFKNLLPDKIYEKLGNNPIPLKERLEKFVKEDFIIFADGKQLEGRIVAIGPRERIKRDKITGEPLPVLAEEAETVLFVVIEYPLKEQPSSLTLVPPRNEGGYASANIGFVTYHQGLAVNDFRYLSGEETVVLDWEDPWYSQFEKRNLWRKYVEPMSVFIYVDPFEVRKEIIVRPKDLEDWIDLGLQGKDTITIEEQEEIKKKVAKFFLERSPVFIDGKKALPVLDRIHFINRTLKMTSVVDSEGDLPVHLATLGVIFIYPTTGLPQEVTVEWDLFNDRIKKINAATVDEAGGLPYPLEQDDSVLVWQNFLKNPTIPSLVSLKPPNEAVKTKIFGIPNPFAKYWGIKKEDADAITLGLLRNVYHAFDYREEEDIYDVLEKSASGNLLTQIYLEARTSLELKNQGGAKVKVKDIEIVEMDTNNLKGEIGFISNCKWNVSGSVGHWGHIHTRKNQYEAKITVKDVDGEWKITDLEILNEKRL